MDVLDAAREWVARGQSVIPIGFRSKRPDFRALKWVRSVNVDGRPQWDTYTTRLPTDDELRVWFGSGPTCNLAVVTGFRGLVVIDFDSVAAYETWVAWANSAGARGLQARELGHQGLMVRSARGRHLYLRVEEPVDSYSAGAVDVKARWGYVLAPPSVHPSGHQYRGNGGQIFTVARLADVFPLGPVPAATMAAARPAPINDPFEAAARASGTIETGAVGAIQAAHRIESLLGLAPTAGREVMIRCPLHNDRNPSMLVNTAEQYAVCFAGCGGGKRMDVIDLYAALNGLSNREAIAEMVRR